MKKICAWCKKDLGTVPFESDSDAHITHGICSECVNLFFAPQRYQLMEFLDGLDAPVIIVDTNAIIKNANSQARKLLQKDIKDIAGISGGDVFECLYAKLPEGCGKTIHCDGCTIRTAVMNTFQTGQSHLKTSACQVRGTDDNSQEIRFLISTEKVREVVLLRIDSVDNLESRPQT